jgi:hypothetical protein
MDKAPLTKEEIERLLIADLRTFADCERAVRVVVIAIADPTSTWTVSCFDHGRSDGDACERALQHIVPRFQRVYDLISKH